MADFTFMFDEDGDGEVACPGCGVNLEGATLADGWDAHSTYCTDCGGSFEPATSQQ